MKIFRFAQKNKALRALGDFGVSNFRDASDWVEIIPVEQKSKLEMHLTGRNNPCGTEKQDRDAVIRCGFVL